MRTFTCSNEYQDGHGPEGPSNGFREANSLKRMICWKPGPRSRSRPPIPRLGKLKKSAEIEERRSSVVLIRTTRPLVEGLFLSRGFCPLP
ncbi:Hypothetical protein NTJ_13620 [Nesidiocoris tenuis]|uniref:Uncharacterized protein n=2 Tax=Nesidiocoris tenuis TaxID=355587 RepID=A0ABN7B944_9HEMI|nr:Hypothetical protein NTJ_13620 [Nesidiocoris tenuis]